MLTEPLHHSLLWRDDGPGRRRPRFDACVWGERGIECIHAEAGGWPHLVQLIAEATVDLLNDEGERQVTSPLLERALDRAIVHGHNVLYELLRRESTLPGEWEYLSKFRSRDTQPLPDDEAIVQSLRRRLLVEEEAGQWRLRVPLLGHVFLSYALARFTRILGTMLKNGIPILQALWVAKDSSGNLVISEAIEKSAQNITAGDKLAILGLIPNGVTA